MSKLAKALTAAAGNAGGSLGYVEDVFSTYLYTGNGSTQTITNGIDLDGEGGLVWSKKRSGSEDHTLFDTEAQKRLETNTTASGGSGYIPTYFNFLGDGYFMDWSAGGMPNDSGSTYASWTFRKAEKFFDVVTYTGTGVAHDIPHNLGSVPACIIVKRTDGIDSWFVYHVGVDATAPEDYFLEMEKTAARTNAAYAWNDTAPTSTHFTVGTVNDTNLNGSTFVAYLFASDAGGFGDDGSESIIKCGSYTGNGTTEVSIDLGWEPQFVIIKNATDTSGDAIKCAWNIIDNMRGWTADGVANYVSANDADAESQLATITPKATGFTVSSPNTGDSGDTYIYIAIRRPMKTPESGTEVFSAVSYTGDGSNTRQITSGFPVDWFIIKSTDSYGQEAAVSRLTGARDATPTLYPSATAAESNSVYTRLGMDYWQTGNGTVRWNNTSGYEYMSWMFKRATGFFDVVAYKGVASSGNGFLPQDVDHNLVAVPEMMIVKCRSTGGTITYRWHVYHKDVGNTQALFLNESSVAGTGSAYWNNTTPTDSVFSVGGGYGVNEASQSYIAYLFASVAGVSKVGSYTGNGTSQTIDCGFSGGARFFLVKASSTTGDWHVFDTARGIVAGNDSYLELNTTNAEDTDEDAVDPVSSGVIVNETSGANINTSGVTYIYLAIS